MDTLKIKALLSAVKLKSLSKAAEEISYTPSALSHMTDSLEAELGVKLLKRTPMGVQLTEDGELLYDKLLMLAEAENDLLKAAKSLSEKHDSTLRIGAYSSISQHLLPEILHSFKTAYPDIIVSITVANRFNGWLEENTADVIFSDKRPTENCEWLPFMTDPFVAIVPSDALKGKKQVQKDELYPYPYISTNETSICEYFDISRFKEVLCFNSVDDDSVLSMVKEGIGVSVLPALVLKKPCKGVRVLKLFPEISRTLGIAFNKNSERSSVASLFIKFLKDITF
ncbi:MAG: LysR family transcriptional regulator [Clostridia bacterium]|nr:LysR family transcriptional regulator [Clostridia bacterium]